VDEVEIVRADNIDASGRMPGDVTPSPYKDTGSAIDITLRNSGDAPALIVNAVFSFTQATELNPCPGAGGALVTSAEYDVKVPTPIAKPVSANKPLILHRDMRFTVNANSVDRFRISVGPDQYADTDWPWIYGFDLSLVEDNGQKLDLGPMSILGFSQSTGFGWDPLHGATQTQLTSLQDLPCIAHDATELSHALANPGLHSPELQMMYQEANRLTTGLIVYVPCCGLGMQDQNLAADYRPRTWSVDATGSHVLQNATWKVWNDTEAIGVGTAAINSCEPACAGGRYYHEPAVVTLSDPQKCGDSWFWSKAVWHFPDGIPPGEKQDQTMGLLYDC
jgi:hypothetical protein